MFRFPALAFEDCAMDPICSAQAVRRYMTRFQKVPLSEEDIFQFMHFTLETVGL